MQRRTLIRVRDLAAFREALVHAALSGGALDARARAIVVPTRAAGELLRQALERRLTASRPAVVLPDFLTRAELYDRLREAAPDRPRLLARVERELLLERAARAVVRRPRMERAPFHLRPGLVAAMLDLYDELGRRLQTVPHFARALFDQLRGARGMDRGSEELIRQTCFLGFSFVGYATAVRASGACDEHLLRRMLLASQPAVPYRHLVVAVADRPSDPQGLWPADFDLIGRLRGIESIDVVVTDGAHDAGLRDRLDKELPGLIEDRRHADHPRPTLVRPAGAALDELCVVSRDREEELRDVARIVRARAAGTGVLATPTAVVFHRPLPYLYLAPQVFGDAGVAFQSHDARPLATEPYAASLDVVMTAARTGATREAAAELLRAGLLQFDVDGVAVSGADALCLDRALTERRATGEADTFLREADRYFDAAPSRERGGREAARRAALAAAAARDALGAFRAGASASAQVRALSAFLRQHERPVDAADPGRARHQRARAAVLGALDGLAAACERHDDAPRPTEHMVALVRHVLEGLTFRPESAQGGVHLVDAVAARFGEFADVHVVGLVETDWPERPRRSIFYTGELLAALGWPQAPDLARVEQAAFSDLLGLASSTVHLHRFHFEGDALLAASPMVELARDVPAAIAEAGPRRLSFADEVLTEWPAGVALAAPAGEWRALRAARGLLSDLRRSGQVDPQPPQRYRVSRVDRYLDCPFKYFAENVLGLPEERDEMAGLSPLERGRLVHEVFEAFYRQWDAEGRGTITAATLPDALAMFERIAEAALAPLPDADRVLERTRWFGSVVARGVAEHVFEVEADAGGDVVRRLIEFDLKGPFTFPLLGGLASRDIEIHGKADRIDVFRDGALRVVDYKLSKVPDMKATIQIAVYAHAAQQALQAADGLLHPIRDARYVPLGGDDEGKGQLAGKDSIEAAVLARAGSFAGTVAAIERGEFPARPRRMSDCGWCRFAGVCRKEYREEADEAAESV